MELLIASFNGALIVMEAQPSLPAAHKPISDRFLHPINPPTDETCSICLDEDGRDWVKTPCNHVFHRACIKKWLHKRCPNCQMELED